MSMNRPEFLRGLAGAGAGAAFVLPATLPAWAQSAKPIVLGASLSLSGIYADGGKYCLEGYQLAINQVNAKGGVLGRPLQLKYYDDQSDGATGIRLYERLINEDKVDVIVGPYGTAITAPTTNVAEKYKMPMICPETADVVMFSRGYRYIFQALGPVQSYIYGIMSIAHDRGFKKLAVVGGDVAFAHSLANAVPTIARGFGQAIVYQEFYPGNASDFSSVVEKIRNAQPDVLLAMSFPIDSVGLLRQLKVANYAPKMVYEAIGASDPQFVKNVGEDAEGIYSAVSWNIAAKDPANVAFMKSYAAAYQRPPDYHAAANFACIEVVVAALKKAGAVDQEKLRDAYATTQVPTILGTYHVEPRTGIQIGYISYMIQWQHGKQIVVYPGNVSDGKPQIPLRPWNARS
jgi:branched-chain amino acid transport system substrate-binding protein